VFLPALANVRLLSGQDHTAVTPISQATTMEN
jgi:hypothetical protein